ncbi:LacI family DNA-binding transcriptional regulator [Micromonospora sp. NPDC047740]|uniref:LacI family DNA-binding transcriptional regulator n=1 Tax=Micromonospora sp. NPDC047740 TaxID=3364254 RepID=UPI003711A2BA
MPAAASRPDDEEAARMVSISDVARHAGVSPTTVSHTLSGKRKVSETVREKVRRAMVELDYVPTRAAQSLALGKTSVLAVVVPDIAIEYFAELAKGIESVAMERGYNMLLATTGFDSGRESRYLEMIASRAVDGIIYASGAVLGAKARAALNGHLPVILVDEEIEGIVDLPAIVSDNEAGGRIVAEHLLSLGHRSVLEIQGAHAPVTSVRRSTGFASAWEPAGGRVFTTSGDYSVESGPPAVDGFADAFAAGEITAVFAHNDLMALGAIEGLRAQGFGVPRDVSVVGFDDVSISRHSSPPLTTVRQDTHELGTLAARTLLHALETGEQLVPGRIAIPVELIVRASTGEVRR